MLIVNIQKELGMMCGVDMIRKGMSHICLKLIVLILGGGMMRYELNFDEDKVNDVLVVGGASYDLKGCCDIMNEQQATIITLKRRLEKINGGYGLLTHRNGLTANECLIESQERELEKKNEQISDWIERHSKDIEKISEQQNTISQLEEENDQLRQMIKENVFGRYAEGSFADLKFKATAYDDIIKLKISNKLVEPKLTVICKRGKKENVQSFCRMFIPHGMYYEIKELEE